MKTSQEFVDLFIKKLKNDEFTKEIQPNNGPSMSDEFVSEQISSYAEFLDSDVMKYVFASK